MKKETIEDLRQELSTIDAKIKLLKQRKLGLTRILEFEKMNEPEEIETAEKEVWSKPKELKPLHRVPLSFDFHILVGDEWRELVVKHFKPGDIVRAVKANRVVPVHGKTELIVAGIDGEDLLIEK